MKEKYNLIKFHNKEEIACPNCSEKKVRTRYEVESFKYGMGKEAVELKANVPIGKCEGCGLEFTDDIAEDLRHEAVCKHLGRLTPMEIKTLRKINGLTRKEFSDLTLFGEASLARWENGELIQNGSNDQLLRLLTFEDNINRLYSRNLQPIKFLIH